MNLQFSLEINIFHEWEADKAGYQMSPLPATTASVLLYGDAWDENMRSGAPTPRGWESSFVKQFLSQMDGEQVPGNPPHGVADHLDHFLAWVEWIQKALEG